MVDPVSSLVAVMAGQSAGGRDEEEFRAAGEEEVTAKSVFDPAGQRSQVWGEEQALDWCQVACLPYCCVTLGKLVAPSGFQCPRCERRVELENL